MATAPTDSPLVSGSIIVLPWADPAVDAVGHDPRSPYVERFWLGVLGPTTTWLLRRLADGFDTAPDGYEVDLDGLAVSLGLQAGGVNGPFARALGRCVTFGMAHPHSHGLSVRRRIPPVGRRHLLRMPPALQADHAAFVASADDPRAAHVARVIARALRRGGFGVEQVARTLEAMGTPRRLADEAVAAATAPGGDTAA